MDDGSVRPPAEVLAEQAARYGVTVDALCGRGRTKWLAEARRAVVVALYGIGMGSADIGRILGRDRATVRYLASVQS